MAEKSNGLRCNERGDGRTYQRGNRWWIEYWHRGKQYRESGGRTDAEARRKLKCRLREILADRFVGPREERVSVAELLDSLILHLTTKGSKSVREFVCHIKPVRAHFCLSRAVEVTSTQIEEYMQRRIEAGRAVATVNREVSALRMALNLARRQGRLARVPFISLLAGETVRRGFFQGDEVQRLLTHLSEPVNDLVRFAYLTGWRRGEIVRLRWDQVDRALGEVRLGTSKNGRPRSLPLDHELRDLIEKRWAAREFTTCDGITALSPFVFHNVGRPVGEFRKSWATACRKAGVPGRLFHDLRRSAVRDMVRAGVPETVAMSISGHRTRSVFDRYDITSMDDMREAIRRTQEHRASRPAERTLLGFSAAKEPGR